MRTNQLPVNCRICKRRMRKGEGVVCPSAVDRFLKNGGAYIGNECLWVADEATRILPGLQELIEEIVYLIINYLPSAPRKVNAWGMLIEVDQIGLAISQVKEVIYSSGLAAVEVAAEIIEILDNKPYKKVETLVSDVTNIRKRIIENKNVHLARRVEL